MTDDQTQASLEKMGTVRSDLAAQGATFADSFTNWPLCCPSRVTFYTGQYAHNHKVLGNSPPDGGFQRFDDDSTLPVWLKQAGYHTIHVGKYLNGYGEDATNSTYVPPGWDEWYAGTAGSTQDVYDYTLNQNGTLVDYGAAVEDFKQDVFSDLAVDAINRNAGGGPFFMGVMYTAPHSGGPNPNPHPPTNCGTSAKPAPRHATAFDSERLPTPPNFNEADVSDKPAAIQAMPVIDQPDFANMQRRYRCRIESLLSVDDGVGRIVDALEAAGELDNTLIMFTSDNGFFAGEHRVQNGKDRVYEESVRVPLVMRGPGIPGGVAVEDLAVNADLASTVLDAAGVSAGLPQDGRSLLPFAAHPARFHGRELLLEKGDVLDEDDDGVAQSGTFAAIRTSRYVYVDNATGELELYDLETDPYQLQNQVLNPAYDAAEAALASRLATLRSCAAESCRTKPALEMKLPRHIRIENGRSCRDASRVIVKVRGSGKSAVVNVRYFVGSKKAGHDDAAPFAKRILPRLVRAKRRPNIRAIAEMVDGREISFQKRIRPCR
jgi:arylsulfatase A-like enzyme